MPYLSSTNEWKLSERMVRLKKQKESALEIRERKCVDWDDNYELYRNKIKTNRLTQRQAVNIPLMKETIKTLLSKIDDAPEVDWSELAGDEMKELIYQSIWDYQSRVKNFELIDIIDKKNVLLYGFSVKKLNIADDGIDVAVLDVYDTLFDPLYSPWDLESSRFIIHQNIFRSVKELIADDRYKNKDELKLWVDSPAGIIQSGTTREQFEDKMERIKSMGIDNSDFPHYAAGDTIVNLTEHYTTVWNTEDKKWERRVVVYADDMIELLDEKLTDLIGVDFWPFVAWTEDPETNDTYPDSVGDMVRVPNKVLNVWISQLIENRTLKNFQMHWYMPDTDGKYVPQTYIPGPGKMLPAPPGERIGDVIQPVEVSGLDDTLEAIATITNIVERSTGATAIEKGQSQQGVQTLGEVEVLVGKATERATSMQKFYRKSWYELAKKWDALMQENPPVSIRLFKFGKSGKAHVKKVYPSDWVSSVGYEPTIRSTSEQEQNNVKTIQKFTAVIQQFPENVALRKIAQRRVLEILDLTPEELREIESAEEVGMTAQATPMPQQATPTPNLAMEVQDNLAQLQELNQ